MKILAVSYDVPRPDQSSGELRFFSLLSFMARNYEVSFYSADPQPSPERDLAAERLRQIGIKIENGSFAKCIRNTDFDVVFFEFYFVAESLIDLVRAWCPSARTIVDSVDVHFHRLRSKARLTGVSTDHDDAESVCAAELGVYRKADLVLTVSDEDRGILLKEGLKSDIDVIPNIHSMQSLVSHQRSDRLELIFVGSYTWSPNVDAMLYFCHEVLPLVRQKIPQLRLRIVGSCPTDEVKALSADDVCVVGFVPETTSYLLSSDISIAPLRYGGGIKGKIGEALAHGVPVVTTSIGAEGFGFQSGKEVLIADTAEAFAEAIDALWKDEQLYERVRTNGWSHINDRYSVEVVERLIGNVLERLSTRKKKRLSAARRIRIQARHYLDRYVIWRFRT